MHNQHTTTKKAHPFSLQSKITDLSPYRASRIVGISWVIMFIMAIPIVLLILEKMVVKGDEQASLANIIGKESILYMGIAGYMIILILDATIAIGLYSVLKYTNRTYAILVTVLRLIFVIITATSLLALGFLQIEFYTIGTLVGYIFLIPHLFFLGLLTYKAWYLPTGLGLFMILTSFSYIITMFGGYFLSSQAFDALYPIAMIPASLGEISLGIYLILRASKIEERINFN
ncbi:MAG: DUF4386 domain-containing protein [Candidatus Heimdallarchaeota archaeon]|nr:DUF4386 domain-containing protein [Candidatus Heimdallarchaeota archaeon]